MLLWRGSGPVDVLNDGALVSLTTILWNVVQIGALAFVARLVHWPPGEYLGLIRPNGRDSVLALVSLAVFLPSWDALTYLLGMDIVPAVNVASYLTARTSGALPLLWITTVVAAPVGEEIMFRGFLYRGWVQSQRGVLPGVVIISTLWALVHGQYDWFWLLEIFLLGLLFGWARWQSGSTALTMLMHGIANLVAMLETAVIVEWRS
jgi:uncharacterized protein